MNQQSKTLVEEGRLIGGGKLMKQKTSFVPAIVLIM